MHFDKGIRSCPKQQYSGAQSPNDRVERFSLTGGAAGETTKITRKWSSGESREILLKIPLGALNVNIRAGIRAEEEIELTYGLPEGHEYEVRYLAKQHGIDWAVK